MNLEIRRNDPYMTAQPVSHYVVPRQWVRYDIADVAGPLIEARTAAGVLSRMAYLPQWIEQAHEEQLRLEAVGTARIEGAEFTQRERDEALAPDASARTGLTHSQRQLRSANATYRWLRSLQTDQPVTAELILDIHRRMVTGCDDDRCEPGATRSAGNNVTFGMPRCQGIAGGDGCRAAFNRFADAIAAEFPQHDRIIQAMAAHYHIGAMHPFGDGNGRTARALEALMLREAHVNDMVMVSLSNYYYEHAEEYRAALYASRRNEHDLTPFLLFALPAVAESCNALVAQIVDHQKRVLYREFARSLFGKLRSNRRRALAERQLRVLDLLLDAGELSLSDLYTRGYIHYKDLKHPVSAMARDMVELLNLSAVKRIEEWTAVNLDWPQQFSESALLERYESMPSAASTGSPAMAELSRLLGRHD